MSDHPVAGLDPRYAAAWDAWVATLALQLLDEPDRGSALVLTAPRELARPRQVAPRRFLGLRPAIMERTAPWVELRRVEDHLAGRCIGSAAMGSGFPISEDEDAALLALGWRRPGLGEDKAYIRWWPDDVPHAAYLPAEEAARAAQMVAATLRDVFAVTDPATLGLTRR